MVSRMKRRIDVGRDSTTISAFGFEELVPSSRVLRARTNIAEALEYMGSVMNAVEVMAVPVGFS